MPKLLYANLVTEHAPSERGTADLFNSLLAPFPRFLGDDIVSINTPLKVGSFSHLAHMRNVCAAKILPEKFDDVADIPSWALDAAISVVCFMEAWKIIEYDPGVDRVNLEHSLKKAKNILKDVYQGTDNSFTKTFTYGCRLLPHEYIEMILADLMPGNDHVFWFKRSIDQILSFGFSWNIVKKLATFFVEQKIEEDIEGEGEGEGDGLSRRHEDEDEDDESEGEGEGEDCKVADIPSKVSSKWLRQELTARNQYSLSGFFSRSEGKSGFIENPYKLDQLTMYATKNQPTQRRVPSLEGDLPRRWYRATIDNKVFAPRYRKAHKGTFTRMSILVDLSGSMHWDDKSLTELVEYASSATVIGYCGEGDSGRLLLIADRGRAAKSKDINRWRKNVGQGNIIDLPSLMVLSKMPGLKIWVCDGLVTGKGDKCSVSIDKACDNIRKTSNIKNVHDVNYLLAHLQVMG